MAVSITSKRVVEVSDIALKNPDGSPMVDEAGAPVTATVFGPGTKIWTVADAHRRREAMKRTRVLKGKYEAAVDNEDEDAAEFLCAVVKRFNNLEYEGVQGDRETVKAVFDDPLLGFIRDQLLEDTHSWENFMKASATPPPSTSGNLPG